MGGRNPIRYFVHEGQRFGRLVCGSVEVRKGCQRHIAVRCDCGVEKTASIVRLVRGATRSCGCLARESSHSPTLAHGESGRGKTPEYVAWKGARNRCLNNRDRSYPNYGGRGIRICDRWLSGESGRGGYDLFLADMGRKPSPEHSLDRIDPNGHYEPGNCRWATKKTQSENRRSVIIVEIDGLAGSLKDAARRYGVDYQALHYQVSRKGLSAPDALLFLQRRNT